MTALEDLLDKLDRASTPGDRSMWVQAMGHAGRGGTLTVNHDMSRLFGWVAPDLCWAVGVVAGANAYPLGDDGAPPPPGRAGTRRVTMACFVGRDGEIVSRTHDPEGLVTDQLPTGGRTFDALHRCLGLPTPPPERSSSELLSLIWLSEILAAGQPRSRPSRCRGEIRWPPGPLDASLAELAWEDVAALHPAIRTLTAMGCDIPIEHLDAVLRAAGRAWSWANLRRQSASAKLLSGVVSPQLAGWMDDGMYSRWMLDRSIPVSEVLATARPMLAPDVGERLQRCLVAVGIELG